MAVWSTLVGTTGMRRTRASHILIEFYKEVAFNEVGVLKMAASRMDTYTSLRNL